MVLNGLLFKKNRVWGQLTYSLHLTRGGNHLDFNISWKNSLEVGGFLCLVCLEELGHKITNKTKPHVQKPSPREKQTYILNTMFELWFKNTAKY